MKIDRLLIVFLAISVLAGCQGNPGEPAPALTGSLVGYVIAPGGQGSVPLGGATVTVENQTPALTTVTDAAGRYEFPGLKAGTYSLSYSRSGYGSMRLFSVGHVGGNEPTYVANHQYMAPVASTAVTSLSFGTPVRGSSISYTLTLGAPLAPREVVKVYFSTSPITSLFPAFPVRFDTEPNISGSSGSGTVFAGQFNAYGLPAGSTVYAVAYVMPSVNVAYFDWPANRNVYPCMSAPSGVQTLTAP